MDKLTQIEAFVAAAEQGSLAKAALAAHVTAVMIGRRIDALERRLGVKLLHRSTRRLALTEQGAAYLDECRRLVADLERAESCSPKAVTKRPGIWLSRRRLHSVAGTSHRTRRRSSRVIRMCSVSFNLTDQVVDLVQLGFDMGIRIGGEIDPNFVAVRLASNGRVVCAHRAISPVAVFHGRSLT